MPRAEVSVTAGSSCQAENSATGERPSRTLLAERCRQTGVRGLEAMEASQQFGWRRPEEPKKKGLAAP